mmetsp:Transcript_11876/g.33852  ORF Transcript_11876/g.33852 Transcript_11876/m.33852 type:complete len:204 (+) Transcript_11876:229-840(+)
MCPSAHGRTCIVGHPVPLDLVAARSVEELRVQCPLVRVLGLRVEEPDVRHAAEFHQVVPGRILIAVAGYGTRRTYACWYNGRFRLRRLLGSTSLLGHPRRRFRRCREAPVDGCRSWRGRPVLAATTADADADRAVAAVGVVCGGNIDVDGHRRCRARLRLRCRQGYSGTGAAGAVLEFSCGVALRRAQLRRVAAAPPRAATRE